jgi:two-component system, OmpR family, phosphate regulon sensor histidine kinase PhoR
LATGLRAMNDFKQDFSATLKFIPKILVVVLVMSIFSSYIFQFSLGKTIILTVLCLITALVAAYFISQRQRFELEKIREVIQKIRTNAFTSADEINLSRDLVKLEVEIKSMFLKTKEDIANLKKIEKYRTEFLGNVSHELRTPIFAIQGYIETLLDGALEDKNVNRNFLEKANRHTQNLNSLLNDLIDISMIESGQMLFSYRYFNAWEFLEGIVNELKPHAEKKNLELILLQFNNTLQLLGDKQRLKQAMTNLIVNAIKYTETGKVEVGIEEEEQIGCVFVRDSGIGISASDLNRIFERFYRVDKDRSRELGGTGLGLAIVKHIVEAHGSKIEVKSEVGKGSTFSFKLKK